MERVFTDHAILAQEQSGTCSNCLRYFRILIGPSRSNHHPFFATEKSLETCKGMSFQQGSRRNMIRIE
eukprot:scaffold149_cov179-Amphora_coffeaeformis.AAC.5